MGSLGSKWLLSRLRPSFRSGILCSCLLVGFAPVLRAQELAGQRSKLVGGEADRGEGVGLHGISTQEVEIREVGDVSRGVQQQELMPNRSGGWIFPVENPPRLIWRDAEEARRLGLESPPGVRWFDSNLHEASRPDHPGRWLAVVEGMAPNGTRLRRAQTLFCLPETIEPAWVPDLTLRFPNFPSATTPPLVREYQAEIERTAKDLFAKSVLDNEQAAILFSGIFESEVLGRPRRFTESAAALNAERHLALKLKLLQLDSHVRPLSQPAVLPEPLPNAEQKQQKQLQADQIAAARRRIDDFCREWNEATDEPFVIKIVLDGQVITHSAFGKDTEGRAIGLDYRCWIASLTKMVTGLLTARFIDQGLLDLDAPVAVAFPDYPRASKHVPTFRQCLNHTAGFGGHGDFGGMSNPHLENVLLNAIELNEPGKVYQYSGTGFELVVKALELIAGQSAAKLYDEQLFKPLGYCDVVVGNASSDAELTAAELASLGELLAHEGEASGRRFFRPETLPLLLPRQLEVEAAPAHGYGVGLHWVYHRIPGADPNSVEERDLLFSPRTVGHGSFSGCILVVDLERKLVIAQARRQFKDADSEWYAKFFQVVAEALKL